MNREQIARIIDPEGWARWDADRAGPNTTWDHTAEEWHRVSLEKADAILKELGQ